MLRRLLHQLVQRAVGSWKLTDIEGLILRHLLLQFQQDEVRHHMQVRIPNPECMIRDNMLH
jgi:hypothetical protein